jgi:uncharacterized membrane protein
MYTQYRLLETLVSNFSFIVLARAIHVMAGVTWAGAAFVLAMVVVPLAARFGAEGAGRWLGMVARRAGLVSGISALLTILSEVYLFATLHSHDDSVSGLVLKAGAAAALASLLVGLFVGRPPGSSWRNCTNPGQMAQLLLLRRFSKWPGFVRERS